MHARSYFRIATSGKKKKKPFKRVLIYEKVMKTRSVTRDRGAGDVTISQWVKKLRVERGNASLLSGDKCNVQLVIRERRKKKRFACLRSYLVKTEESPQE